MEDEKQKIHFKPLLVALLVAILIHLELLLTGILPSMYRYWSELFPRPEPEAPTEVTLVSMSPRDFEQNRQIQPKVDVERAEPEPEPPAPPEPEEKPDPDKLPKGQVVDVAPTPDSSPPKDARFLSEHNTNVEQESVSRHQRADYSVAQPKPTVADDQRKRLEQPKDQKQSDRIAMVTRKRGDTQPEPGEKAMAFEIPDIKKREALNLKLDLDMGELSTYSASDELRGNSERMRLQMGKPGDSQKAERGERGEHDATVAMFKQPALDQLDMVTGAPANDHIEDVTKGESTLLNSREFKYATFFNRVKRSVSQHWSPRVGEEYRRRDPYGNIYGVRDRRTLLDIWLDGQGELVDVEVAKSSGVQFFDDVAIQSFRDASPFPNPPAGLVEPDGRIYFQFGFYFMIGERPLMRAFQFSDRPY